MKPRAAPEEYPSRAVFFACVGTAVPCVQAASLNVGLFGSWFRGALIATGHFCRIGFDLLL